MTKRKKMRVLLATLIGGSIASVTWAYTAEGIVKFMHQYKLEVFIPLVRQQFPEIVDFYLPPEGCSYRMAIVTMKKQ